MTMWRKSMFELVEKHEIPLNFDQESDVYTNNQTCLITVLRTSPAAKLLVPFYVIVANVHLCYNIRRGDIKLAQTQLILSCIAEIKKYYTLTEAKTITFLCGDFNSTPSSGIYRLITQGNYDCKTLQMDLISGQKESKIRLENKERHLVSDLQTRCAEVLRKAAYFSQAEPGDVSLVFCFRGVKSGSLTTKK